MTPNFKINIGTYSVKKFKSGEIQVKLEGNYLDTDNDLLIEGSILSSDQLIELCQLVEAFRHYNPLIKIVLVMPYCSYSRQDRRCSQGESFSLKVFTNIINSLNLSKVFTIDNHSDVATALINNIGNISVSTLLADESCLLLGQKPLTTANLLESPDAGANKKIQDISSKTNIPFIRADKIRSLEDNSVSNTIVYATPEQLDNKTLLIVDDICDGGRTFIELTKAIKAIQPNCTVNLYVTHGFFTYGLDPIFESGINTIYTTNSVSQYHNIPSSDKFKILDLDLF